jgi:hypothetical protein
VPAGPAPAPTRLQTVVLRGTAGVSLAVADAVDAALLRELAHTAGLTSLTVSPIELDEIRLTTGCRAATRACLGMIAETLAADSIVLRELTLRADGTAELSLAYLDPDAREEPLTVRGEVSATDASAAARAVPPAVRALFRLPDQVLAAPQPMDQGATPTVFARIRMPTWIVLGSGAAAIAAGIVLGVLANGSHQAYLDTRVESAADADRAADHLSAAEDRALAANLFLAAGAIAIGAGGVMVALDLGLFDDETATPSRAMATVSGALDLP